MSVVVLCSVKGAPGVTTLGCLLAAAWPGDGSAVVVEADPAGGDLAARFGLSVRRGWSSVGSAIRRHGTVDLADHVQGLPGGVEVLVASETDADPGVVGERPELLARVAEGLAEAAAVDLVVDLGRLWPPGAELAGAELAGSQPPGPRSVAGPRTGLANAAAASQRWWMGRAEHVLLVHGRDAASVLGVRARADEVVGVAGDRLALVPSGRGSYRSDEIEAFVGIPVAGVVPDDARAASWVSGDPGRLRRLVRSPLIAAIRDLAVAVAHSGAEDRGTGAGGAPSENPEPEPCTSPPPPAPDDPAGSGEDEQLGTDQAVAVAVAETGDRVRVPRRRSWSGAQGAQRGARSSPPHRQVTR